MTIVLPILFFVVGVGLYARQMTFRLWLVIALWIALVIAVNYIKPVKMTGQQGGAVAENSASAVSVGL